MWSTALWHQALWENILPVLWPTCTCNTYFVHFESKLEFNSTHYASPSGTWISCYGKRNCLFFHNTRRTYLLISILRPHPPPWEGSKSSSFSSLRSFSRFIFPWAGGDIKLQQRQKQPPITTLPAGLPSPLSAVSSKSLLLDTPNSQRNQSSVCSRLTITALFPKLKAGF